MTDPVTVLDVLIERVLALIDVLERDPRCTWAHGFRDWLADAEASRPDADGEGLMRLALNLSRLCFGSMGSFNDYTPQVDGQIALWAEEAQELSGRVAREAWQVRQGVDESGDS